MKWLVVVVHCAALSVAGEQSPEVVAFGFPAADPKGTAWRSWDWAHITTAVIVHEPPADLVATARRHGSRVVQNVGLPRACANESVSCAPRMPYAGCVCRTWNISNTTARDAWVAGLVATASALSLDGISLDIESNHVEQRDEMTALVAAVATAFRTWDPRAVVLFSVTMYPFANYSKAAPAVFDYGGIARHCDFFFIMGYDTFGYPKTAHGGGRLDELAQGLQQYLRLGVPASKLVVGIGLFGFDFPCDATSEPTSAQDCHVPAGTHPFRTPDLVPIASFPGPTTTELQTNSTGAQWDPVTSQPFFNYNNGSCWHQVWYESEHSIALKRSMTDMMGLGGIGVFLADFIGTGDERAVAMWRSLLPATITAKRSRARVLRAPQGKEALSSGFVDRNEAATKTLFAHGDGGLLCVRSPTLLEAGGRIIAIAESWNYTGNFCFPKNGTENTPRDPQAYQEFAVRYSDDGGARWSPYRPLPLGKLIAWNAQLAYSSSVLIVHVKERAGGSLWQVKSHDRGETWSTPENISRFFPGLATDTGLRPSPGSGIVMPPSGHSPAGRILMTGFTKEQPPACYVYASADTGATWSVVSRVDRAFECSVARLSTTASAGGDQESHRVYLNARHVPLSSPVAAGSAVQFPRVQATSNNDGGQFERSSRLGPTFDPDSGGVLGATTSMMVANAGGGSNSSVLFFAIAAGPAPEPAQLRDQKVSV